MMHALNDEMSPAASVKTLEAAMTDDSERMRILLSSEAREALGEDAALAAILGRALARAAARMALDLSSRSLERRYDLVPPDRGRHPLKGGAALSSFRTVVDPGAAVATRMAS